MRGQRASVIVLGAGPAGLAAGCELAEAAIVLEREARPGGLVRTENRGGYWFDHVLHLLYFADPVTELRIREMLGDDLAECVPEAWVESRSGITRFPLQMHLGTLRPEAIVACLRDLAACTYGPASDPPTSFEALLLASFGRALCEEFFFPYNRKVWKRPLSSLAPSGFQWNITQPSFADVLRGAISDQTFRAYNARGFYPRPSSNAPIRGMEVLSSRLAKHVPDLRVGHRVEAIDLEERVVWADTGGARVALRYDRAILSTLPLSLVVGLCLQAPSTLVQRCRSLASNRVYTVALAITGPRPIGRGHWRYYADEAVCFTRLVYMHEFDRESAPPHGWSLLVELTEPSEAIPEPHADLTRRVIADVEAVGALPPGCEVIDAFVMVNEPAYVVFDASSRSVVEDATAFLTAHDVFPLGRYGRWEYSSMAQVMRDGFALGRDLRSRAGT